MIAFVFPGQGSQFVGMADELPRSLRDRFMLRASQILGYNLEELCHHGPEEKLKMTIYTQPAIVTTSIIAYEMVKENGVVPSFVAGHSVGEYSALYAAGVLNFDSVIRLVAKRAKLMEEYGRGTMAAVIGLSLDEVTAVVNGIDGVVVANINSPTQIVISGETESVERAEAELKEKGAKRVIQLKVGGAFHSFIYEEASEIFAEYIDSFQFQKPSCPVLPNVTGEPTTDPVRIKECLKKQIISPVRWSETVINLGEAGVKLFVEVGPGKVLSGLIKRTIYDARTFTICSPQELSQFLEELKGSS
ncbi:[acyl-carrier-protein] S-malonyltransferase [candidate division WOR-3 bacterium]|uniref:Malonyl CoA-acyl carrier protein transacylase n=1 Tax=candidate division WOR-3 bacterium TaxID=2052148 RepID=A0A660SIC9_UNCW3|nr:MAG: [acyl-carrier-protein] S-malonyltransferase [candidate division WOR-3 bacterium]